MLGVVAALMYSGVLTFILVKIVNAIVGIRGTDKAESNGLVIALHNEQGFSL